VGNTVAGWYKKAGSKREAAKLLGMPRTTFTRWLDATPDKVVEPSREKLRRPVAKNVVRDFKRVLAIGDMHCGHFAGLTPPPWQVQYAHNAPVRFKQRSIMQREAWDHFESVVKSLGHIDVMIVNGDSVDGKGKRSGGVELITTSTTEQAEMASECIKFVGASEVHMTHGTGYHVTTDGEECEDWIAREAKATIGDHVWLDINGCVFDVKHHLGSSSIPHGRATQLAKEYVWNRLWEEIDGAPKGNIFIRSHVHYHIHVGDSLNYLAMTLPPLQGPATKFGAQRCSGTVNFGLVHFDVPNDFDGDIQKVVWYSHIKKLQAIKPKVVKCGRFI